MTEEEIKCADCIIERASFPHATEVEIVNSNSINPLVFQKVVTFLKDEGLIEIGGIGGGWPAEYKSTTKGHGLYDSKMGMQFYLVDKEIQRRKQNDKEKRDEDHKILQMKDLTDKLEIMNKEQLRFWQSGLDRDKRAKWQFWLTLFIGLGGFILSIINFIKNIILK